ncbi:MAG: O-acetyl-ADP-ribose deacetylase [Eubacteriaceae bacterium]|jgi:O-acetyl-ADP-ribose deacetylase (regulator of RNase III)|nr:O-acetyl-ADP-ribose deacetylase [Eubacteriaceae bacterium]MDD4508022.1 O-acetyl-ADP-ribose deacetylase [Eubacteriaceae bacterium]
MIRAIKGDITLDHDVDAIVNAANCSLLGGGGVDGAIHQAAGPELLKECRTLGGCPTGEARITRAYHLPCQYVIHTPGPVWHGGGRGEAQDLVACYRSCMNLAVEHDIKRLAFPSIATGVYRYPLKEAAHLAIQTVHDFTFQFPGKIEWVLFVLYNQETFAAYQNAIFEICGRR